MIRRLQHDAVLETIVRRAVSGGRDTEDVEALPADLVDLGATAYRDGYAEGFEAGEQDGRRDAEQRQQELEQELRLRLDDELQALTHARESLAALTAGLENALRGHNDAMQELAFEVALTSLSCAFGAMAGDGELLQRLCAQLVDEYRTKALRLGVAPSDLASLPEQIEGLDVVAETDLTAGHCRVLTARGHTESSIAMRLDAIYEAMRESLGLSTSGASRS
ncbi:MAG: hypothetical protein WA777_08450 [Rhodanobacter sp.]